MNDAELLDALKNQRFQFAKTYAKFAPHEYIVDEWNKAIFDEMADRIAHHKDSYSENWRNFGTFYKYYTFGGYKFWICGCILNREPVPPHYFDLNGNVVRRV